MEKNNMDDPQNQDMMDKPCEICGDIGYVDVIVVCSQCKITREHAYCMKVVHEDDPETWVCEECKYPNQIPISKPVPSKQTEIAKTRFSMKKPPSNSKVQYITPEDAMVLESGALKNSYSSPSKPCFSSRSPKNKMSAPKNEPIRSKAVPPRFSLKPNPQMAPPGFRKLLNDRSRPCSSAYQKLSTSKGKEKAIAHKEDAWKESPVGIGFSVRNTRTSNATVEEVAVKEKAVVHKQHSWKESPVGSSFSVRNTRTSNATVEKFAGKGIVQHVPVDTPTEPLISGEPHSPNAEGDSRNAGRTPSLPVCSGDPRRMDSGRNSPKVAMGPHNHKQLPNHPAESPTWKGSFKVMGDVVPSGFYDGIQAHPPSKVHRQAYELSKRLPKVLQVELLPPSHSWVLLYKDAILSEIDIGLYFVPSKRHDEIYYCLVEYLDRCGVLLRSYVDGVELLIFSSKHLEEASQRLDQKYFLWGQFCCSETASGVASLLCPRAELELEGPIEDMVVDMIGGHDVGRVDVKVPKPTEGVRLDPEVGDANPETPTMEIKVEMESFGGTGASPLPTSCVTLQIDFERELQRRFDRFSEMMVKSEAGAACVKVEDHR